MKKVLFFIVTNLALGDQTPLTFYPQFSTDYFSSGSIHHTSSSGYTAISTFGLGAKKSEGPFSISGLFQFTTAQNLEYRSTFFNPELNIEMNRDFLDSDNTWFESSNLKMDYSTKSLSVFFGKFNTRWGKGHSGLIISNNIPGFPQGGFSWKLSETLSLEYFLGALSSQIVDSTKSELYDEVGTRDAFYPRSIAAHRLQWQPFSFLTFNAMETVIFGDRSVDVHYLLPFIPFWSLQHYTGDLDNVQMCGEIIWHLPGNWDLYGSLFVDEWRPEWTFDKSNRNWFGYQLGGIGKNVIQQNDQLRIEYNWTDHRVYRHRFPINDSYSYQYSLGFWAGPHAEETFLSYDLPLKSMDIQTFISRVKRGELTDQMLKDQYDNIIFDRFSGDTESRTIFNLICKKGILNNKVILKFGGEWIDWKNPGFDPFQPNIEAGDFSKFSVILGVSGTAPISFD